MWGRVVGSVVREILQDCNAFELVGEGSMIFQNIRNHSPSGHSFTSCRTQISRKQSLRIAVMWLTCCDGWYSVSKNVLLVCYRQNTHVALMSTDSVCMIFVCRVLFNLLWIFHYYSCVCFLLLKLARHAVWYPQFKDLETGCSETS